MNIEIEKIKGKNLKAGDLFSSAGELYWKHYKNNKSLAEKVYIRTEEPCPKNQENDEIYKIIVK